MNATFKTWAFDSICIRTSLYGTSYTRRVRYTGANDSACQARQRGSPQSVRDGAVYIRSEVSVPPDRELRTSDEIRRTAKPLRVRKRSTALPPLIPSRPAHIHKATPITTTCRAVGRDTSEAPYRQGNGVSVERAERRQHSLNSETFTVHVGILAPDWPCCQ